MAGYLPTKMKRKDLEDVSEEFSEFSLSAPARKIRKRDVGLPPIIEEEEPSVPTLIGQMLSSNGQLTTVADAEPSLLLNEERALVLYKPVNSPLLEISGPSNISFRVDSGVMSGIKNQVFWSDYSNQMGSWRDEKTPGEKVAASNNCLAVVPWVPSQFPEATNGMEEVGIPNNNKSLEEQMDMEEDVPMDIEDEQDHVGEPTVVGIGAPGGLQQWQQHCMTPQLPTSSSTPITW